VAVERNAQRKTVHLAVDVRGRSIRAPWSIWPSVPSCPRSPTRLWWMAPGRRRWLHWPSRTPPSWAACRLGRTHGRHHSRRFPVPRTGTSSLQTGHRSRSGSLW